MREKQNVEERTTSARAMICSCRHSRGMHGPSAFYEAINSAQGFGKCLAASCDCKKFTWI